MEEVLGVIQASLFLVHKRANQEGMNMSSVVSAQERALEVPVVGDGMAGSACGRWRKVPGRYCCRFTLPRGTMCERPHRTWEMELNGQVCWASAVLAEGPRAFCSLEKDE